MNTFNLLKLILNCFEVTACITGFIYWKKIQGSHWKYFPFYLSVIVLAEIVSLMIDKTGAYDLKVGMYNYFVIPLEILFIVWLFYKEFEHSNMRRLPLAAAGIYFVCWLTDMFLVAKNTIWWVNSFSYTTGILLILILILSFLYVLATGDEILFIKNNMMFWVCLGLFVFYFCSLPFFGMGNYLFAHHKAIYIGYAYATYFLNFIMYTFFIISFIWGKPKLSYS